jgi:hypothetical protein
VRAGPGLAPERVVLRAATTTQLHPLVTVCNKHARLPPLPGPSLRVTGLQRAVYPPPLDAKQQAGIGTVATSGTAMAFLPEKAIERAFTTPELPSGAKSNRVSIRNQRDSGRPVVADVTSASTHGESRLLL